MAKSPLSERDFPVVVDMIPLGVLADLGILTAVPVVNVYQPADHRKWCLAVQQWLEVGAMPSQGCPTNDLLMLRRVKGSDEGDGSQLLKFEKGLL